MFVYKFELMYNYFPRHVGFNSLFTPVNTALGFYFGTSYLSFYCYFFRQFQLACQMLLLLLIPSCVFRAGVINQLDWLPIKGLSVITGISFAIEMTGF